MRVFAWEKEGERERVLVLDDPTWYLLKRVLYRLSHLSFAVYRHNHIVWKTTKKKDEIHTV